MNITLTRADYYLCVIDNVAHYSLGYCDLGHAIKHAKELLAPLKLLNSAGLSVILYLTPQEKLMPPFLTLTKWKRKIPNPPRRKLLPNVITVMFAPSAAISTGALLMKRKESLLLTSSDSFLRLVSKTDKPYRLCAGLS